MSATKIKSPFTPKINLLLAAGAFTFAAAMTPRAASASTLTVTNQSNQRIDHLYVALSKDQYWGPDLLGSNVLLNNYHLDISVSGGWYDVKLVDSDGKSCKIENVELRQDTGWTLTDAYLLNCELRSGR